MKMEKINLNEVEGMEYQELVSKAKELGVNYVGKKKGELAEMINAAIDNQSNEESSEEEVSEEAAVEQSEEQSEEEVNEQPEAEQPVNEDSSEEVSEEESPAAEEKKEEKRKPGKWYEQDGAFPYQKGDVVQVVGGPILMNRKASVVQPSAKKNALKGHLIHPVHGHLQKTLVNFDFDNIKLIERDGKAVDENSVG